MSIEALMQERKPLMLDETENDYEQSLLLMSFLKILTYRSSNAARTWCFFVKIFKKAATDDSVKKFGL